MRTFRLVTMKRVSAPSGPASTRAMIRSTRLQLAAPSKNSLKRRALPSFGAASNAPSCWPRGPRVPAQRRGRRDAQDVIETGGSVGAQQDPGVGQLRRAMRSTAAIRTRRTQSIAAMWRTAPTRHGDGISGRLYGAGFRGRTHFWRQPTASWATQIAGVGLAGAVVVVLLAAAVWGGRAPRARRS